jgi:hypothetical protein
MMEENKDENASPARDNKPDDHQPQSHKNTENTGMKIVGINLLIMVIYTVSCKFTPDLGGMLIDAFLIVIHVVVCVIMAISSKNWVWLISAFLILAIGFSTCVYMPGFKS